MQTEKKNVVGAVISIVVFALALIGALLNVVLYIAWQGKFLDLWSGSYGWYVLENAGTLLLYGTVIAIFLGVAYACAQGRNYNRLLLLPFGALLSTNAQSWLSSALSFVENIEYYLDDLDDTLFDFLYDAAELLSNSVGILVLIVLIILVASQKKKNIFAPFLAGTVFLLTAFSDLLLQLSQMDILKHIEYENLAWAFYSIGHNWPTVLLWLGLIILLLPVRAAKQAEETAE